MQKLNPLNNDLNAALEAFNIDLSHRNTTSCFGTAYVMTRDAYW